MNDQPTHGISNNLLNAFLNADDEAVSGRLLAEVIDDVEPLLKSIIRRKLRVSLHATDERQINQEAYDLVSEAKTLIVTKITSLKLSAGQDHIESLEGYAKTVAINVCNQYFRQKYPQRLRLKNQLRYILTHDARFLLWRTEAGEWLCGFCEWRSQIITDNASPIFRLDGLRQKLDDAGISPERSNLVDLVAAIFDQCRWPLAFVDLVTLAYQIRGIKENVEVAEDKAGQLDLQSSDADVLSRLEQIDFLSTLWQQIGMLPLRHRSALLLNLKNSQGDGLITLLPLTRVATIREIAETLEFPITEFTAIWNNLPWDDITIAEHLGLTRQQVINLRQSARATLRRRLNYF